MALFAVLPEERRPLASLLGQSFATGIANTVIMSVAFAVFFTRHGAGDLPWAYLANALLMSVVTGCFLGLVRRVGFGAGLVLLSSLSTASIAAAWILLETTRADWVAFALPIAYQALFAMGHLTIWGSAGRVFDLRQGKRLFGLISAGYWIGSMAVGLAVPLMVRGIGLANMMGVALVAGLAALACQALTVRRFGDRFADTAVAGVEQPRGLWTLLKDRYVLLSLGVAATVWLTFYSIDNLFYERAHAAIPDPRDFASFLGLFLSATGAAAILSTAFGGRVIIDKLGVPASLLLLPLVLTLLVGATAGIGTLAGLVPALFWIASATRLVNVALRGSVAQPALNVGFQLLSPAQRSAVQTASEGLVQPLATGLAGLLLLLLRVVIGIDAVVLSWMILGLLVLWLAIADALGNEYRTRLVDTLRARKLRGTEPVAIDEEGLLVLEDSLLYRNPSAAAYALSVLERSAPAAYRRSLSAVLAHPAKSVRLDALERIEAIGLADALTAIEARLEDEDPEVATRAARTLTVIGGPDSADRIRALLADPRTRRPALVGLLCRGEIDGIVRASEQLGELVGSPAPADRILAADVLGEAGLAGFHGAVNALLADPEPGVRRAALVASVRVRTPQLYPALLSALDDPHSRRTAARALAAGGIEAANLIAPLLADPGARREARIAACQVLGRIVRPEAAIALTAAIDLPDETVRSHAIEALRRHRGHLPATMDEKGEAALRLELADAEDIRAMIALLPADAARTPLGGALAEALDRCRTRIFLLLALLYDPEPIRRAGAALGIRHSYAGARSVATVEGRQRAIAVELLDVTVAARLKARILHLVEPARAFAVAAGGTSLEARLAGLVLGRPRWSNPWLQACALKAAQSHDGNPDIADAIAQALLIEDPVIQDLALRMRSSQGKEKAMISLLERIILLKGSNFFGGLPEGMLAEVAGLLDEVEVEARTEIVQKGATDSAMFLVANGRVGVIDGERELAQLGEGQVFGEMALLDPGERSASVVALEETRLLRLDGMIFQDLLEDNADMAASIIRELVRRLRDTRPN